MVTRPESASKRSFQRLTKACMVVTFNNPMISNRSPSYCRWWWVCNSVYDSIIQCPREGRQAQVVDKDRQGVSEWAYNKVLVVSMLRVRSLCFVNMHRGHLANCGASAKPQLFEIYVIYGEAHTLVLL